MQMGSDCVGDDYSTSVFPAPLVAHSPQNGFSMDFNRTGPGLMDYNGLQWTWTRFNGFSMDFNRPGPGLMDYNGLQWTWTRFNGFQ